MHTQRKKIFEDLRALESDRNQADTRGDLILERWKLHIVIITHIIYLALSWRAPSWPQSTEREGLRKFYYLLKMEFRVDRAAENGNRKSQEAPNLHINFVPRVSVSCAVLAVGKLQGIP